MFSTCFTIVLVKNNYFKNKTLQIVQFQFSTAHFLWQSDQEFPWGGGEMLLTNLILSKISIFDNMSSFPKNINEKVMTA